MLAACSGGSSSGAIDTHQSIKGQHITVLLPSYAALPASMIKQFEAKTGVKVTLNTASWDNIHTQIATASAAGQAVADVTEFDWSWTGQFSATGWYEPLGSVLGKTASSLSNSADFTKDGKLMGACYSNDMRIGMYNTSMFAKAGISSAPTTFGQLDTDLAKLKSSGASQNPLALSLSATEGTSTEWYLLTLMMGGKLFDTKNQPVFDSPNSIAAQALQFEVNAVKNGWTSAGSTGTDNVGADNEYLNGQSAIQFAAHPGELDQAETPGQSKIAKSAAYFLEPGSSGPGATFGLPEALGIPKAAAHKAAAATFINWMMEPTTQVESFKALGLLPCNTTALSQVTGSDLKDGGLVRQETAKLTALFPNGAPAWYSEFSTQAASEINAAAKGNVTVPAAISAIAATARKLANGQ
jgi:multiple sugar transport system substrate-binding protein